MDRRVAISEGRELSDRTSGSVLNVDISHFTSFTDEATRRYGTRRGAEAVSHLVALMTERVVTEVHRYGGSVIGFAGDGITCWFEGDRGRRATAAALAIRDNPPEAHPTPPVKGVVTAGLARRFIVGHPRIQKVDVLAGGIVDRIALADHLAQPGEVVVGGEVVGWLGADAEVQAWRSDSEVSSDGETFAVVAGDPQLISDAPGPPKVVLLDQADARDWVLPPVMDRYLGRAGAHEGEMRTVCPVFLSFSGIDYDFDNDAGTKLDSFVRWVQTVFARHGAFLLQLIVGDKGSYLYGALGAPLAHEEDPLRALRAAESLLHPPPDLPFITDLRAGLDLGPALAGTYGGIGRRTYGVLGQTVNNAARLMQAAEPGQILATAEVLDATNANITAHEVDRLPGRSVYVVEAITVQPSIHRIFTRPSGPLVGRSSQSELIDLRLRGLLGGEAGFIYVRGPVGMGTSRLLAELRDHASSLGVSSLVSACDPIESETPFFAFRRVMLDLLGIDAGSDPGTVRAALREHLGDEDEELFPLLNPLLPIQLPDTPAIEKMPADARGDQTYELLLRAFEEPSGTLRVQVLILDDAQWLDLASYALLELIVARAKGFLVAIGARISPAGETVTNGEDPIEELVSKAGGDVIDLRPLDVDETARLFAAELGADAVPEPLRGVVWERSGGTPLFVEELARALKSRRLVQVREGTGLVEADPNVLAREFPEHLEAVLVARLDALPVDQQTVIRTAAVLGQTFQPDLLGDILGPDGVAGELEASLNALVAEGLLTHQDAEAAPRSPLTFRSDLVRDAASRILVTEQRRSIHARAVQWLEASGASDQVQQFPILAHHSLGAGDTARAADYWIKAAESARQSSFHANAIRFYRQALSLADDLPIPDVERGRWEVRLGESYVQRQGSDSADGRGWIESGLDRIGHPVRSSAAAGLMIAPQLVRQVWWRLRQPGKPHPDRDVLLEASRAYERLVEIYFLGGENSRSIEAAIRTLNLAEKAGPSPELARATATFGALLGFTPLAWVRRIAERYMARALHTVDDTGDRSAMAWVPMVAAFYHAGRAEWDRAEELANRAIGVAQESGDLRRYEDALSNLMIQAYLRGDLTTGLERSSELEERADLRGAELGRGYALQGRAYCLLDLGDFSAAGAVVKELKEMVGSMHQDDEGLVDETVALEALWAARTGDLATARGLADATLQSARATTPSNFSAIATFSAPAEVYVTILRSGDAGSDLRRDCRQAIRLLRSYARTFPIGLPRWARWSGAYAEASDRPALAEKRYLSAIDAGVRLGMSHEETQARQELARLRGEVEEAQRPP